jgi:hypothetical protein
MDTSSRHQELVRPFLGQAIALCILSAVLTLAVGAGYGALASFWQGRPLGLTAFEPSVYAWEAAGLLGVALALFNTTGDSIELDCDQGRRSHSAVTYGLALATTVLFALVLERISHGNWLEPYFHTWRGAAVVSAFLATKLVVMRWHRNSLLS